MNFETYLLLSLSYCSLQLMIPRTTAQLPKNYHYHRSINFEEVRKVKYINQMTLIIQINSIVSLQDAIVALIKLAEQ